MQTLQGPAAYPGSDESLGILMALSAGHVALDGACLSRRERPRGLAAYPVAYSSRGRRPGHDVSIQSTGLRTAVL
jgi:hypothetical protein